MSAKLLRYRILRFIRDWQRESQSLPDLDELAKGIGASVADVDDQIDILEDYGAIKAHRTLGGGASPMITGRGKLMLEDLAAQFEAAAPVPRDNMATEIHRKWDVFICHASEDKEPFVDALASALNRRYSVWYDAFSLRVGDSLRRKIDEGLANSRFGAVVLSPNFFAKEWPQNELDGLASRELGGRKVILPIWLNVDHGYVTQYSPILAGRYAAKASDGTERVLAQLVDAIEERHPGSTIPDRAETPGSSSAALSPQIVEDVGPERPRFDVQQAGASTRETEFQPQFTLAQFSGDQVADLQWRVRGPRFQAMPWDLAGGGQLTRTRFSHTFDLSQPLGHDEYVGEGEMGFEVRYRWRGAWRSEIHRWPITRRDLGHKVLWDIGQKILPPTLLDDSSEDWPT